jgi:hypothetical protein
MAAPFAGAAPVFFTVSAHRLEQPASRWNHLIAEKLLAIKMKPRWPAPVRAHNAPMAAMAGDYRRSGQYLISGQDFCRPQAGR